MRYVYIKNGDAVDQVRRILAGAVDRSGPDAFIGDFIRAHAADELYILSQWRKADSVTAGNIRAEAHALPTGGRLSRAISRVSSAFRIGWRLLRWRPDRIVCGTTGDLLWTAVVIAKLRSIAIVNARHEWIKERRGLPAVVSALSRACVRACTGIVCHGPFLADQIRSIGIPAARIHEFEVDLTEFAAARAAADPPESLQKLLSRCAIVVMYIGRIQRDKGVIDLLDAFRALPASGAARVGLVYVGDGIDMKLLRDSVDERQRDRVLFLGKIPHADLASIISRATVVVAPTRPELPEGRCMVVLESMVVGVPVVAPDFAAFPYVIRNGSNGFLYAPGDSQDLSKKLALIAQSDDVLATLRRGARETAGELLAAHASFSSAVEAAFGKSAGRF